MIEFTPSDESLAEKAKQGERAAFDELYNRYKRPILNYIYRFIGNRASAEELTQEVFVRVYINIHKFEPRAKFSSWLYKIAGNLAKNFLRHAKYKEKPVSGATGISQEGEKMPDLIESMEDEGKGPDKLAEAKETEKLVQEGIGRLPPHLKEVLILCDIEGLAYEEAAKIMRCKPMTVGSRLWRAREKLSGILEYIKKDIKKGE